MRGLGPESQRLVRGVDAHGAAFEGFPQLGARCAQDLAGAGTDLEQRGHPVLHYAHLSPGRNFLQGYRHLHFPRQVRVVEFVCVADAFVWRQFEIVSAEGVAMPGAEIGEGHPVATADLGLQVVDFAGEPVWRKPFCHGLGIQESPVDFLRPRAEYTVKADGIR